MVISSCGHKGFVNTVRAVKAVTNVDRVHAVCSCKVGYHLPQDQPKLPKPETALTQGMQRFSTPIAFKVIQNAGAPFSPFVWIIFYYPKGFELLRIVWPFVVRTNEQS